MHALEDAKRSEEDRNGPLQAAPGDEDLLADPQPDRNEERRQSERARDEGDHDREQEPVKPDALSEQLGDVHRQAEGNEDDDLGEARQRRVEAPDLPLVRNVEVADQRLLERESFVYDALYAYCQHTA